MKTPQMIPHADLIDNFDFMVWCEKNRRYENCDIVKWRYAYIVTVAGARTSKEAAKILRVHIDHVTLMVRKYERMADEYKAEQSA